MDEDSKDPFLSDEGRAAEFARLMALAPSPEQEQRQRENMEGVQRAHAARIATTRPQAPASRLRDGSQVIRVQPDGKPLTIRSLPAVWGEDDDSPETKRVEEIAQREHDAAVLEFKRSRQYRRAIRSHRRPARIRRGARPRRAGRPRVRRTSSSSRTSSADPGSDSDGGGGPSPAARPDLTIARPRARYTFACLTREQRGEATS